jgi:flagellar L-ring protein precursor FlgH
MKKILISLSLLFFVIGCATTPVQKTPPVTEEKKDSKEIKNSDVVAEKVESNEEPMTRYSEVSNMAPPSDRNYKRMTRQKMEDDSELYGSAGSLWKMEGQTSFLFAENKHRREGDPTSIKMEGPALKTIENKVSVIVDLLKQLDDQRKKSEEDAKKAEAEKMRLAQIEEEKKLRAEKIAKGEIVVDPYEDPPEADRKPSATEPVVAAKAEKEEQIDLKEVEFIPSKIVEKMSDGIYRIQGQQFLTIKKKPYKVIATALIRAEDFSDSNISSMKLMDAQYEVIHVKRTAQ